MSEDYSQQADRGGKTGGVAKTGSGPAAAGESAASDEGSAAASGKGTAKSESKFRERAKKAPWWSKFLGLLAIVAFIGATYLVVDDRTGLATAGYIVGGASLIVGVVPLFRG